jgi:hypothetical protein
LDKVAILEASQADFSMDNKKITQQRESYSPPKLKEFGPVGALTQAGSAGGSEAVNMGMQFMA